jgi:folylpolyglutamate synthase/dihydropteroate synthase
VVNPVKLGLSNVHRMYQLMHRLLDGIPIIHVAGTNGKVSERHRWIPHCLVVRIAVHRSEVR